jgi:hypothetical protein
MPVFRFLTRQWIYVEGKDLDEATNKFSGLELDFVASKSNMDMEHSEFHSVQTVEVEGAKGDYDSVDKPLRGGDIK